MAHTQCVKDVKSMTPADTVARGQRMSIEMVSTEPKTMARILSKRYLFSVSSNDGRFPRTLNRLRPISLKQPRIHTKRALLSW